MHPTLIHESFPSLKITDASELLMLDFQYNTFLGGTPSDLTLMANSAASDAPYIGCMRDVYVRETLTDYGWTTLAIELPSAPVERLPMRKSTEPEAPPSEEDSTEENTEETAQMEKTDICGSCGCVL